MAADIPIRGFRWCCCIWFVLCHASSATTIVGVRTTDAIVIGADSRFVRGSGPERLSDVCKIGAANDVVWAYAGLGTVAKDNYSLMAEAKRFMARQGSLDKRLADFETSMARTLQDILAGLKAGKAKYFEELEGNPVVEVLFADDNHGMLRLHVRRFMDFKGVISVTKNDVPSSSGPESTFIILGQRGAIDTDIVSHPGLFASVVKNGDLDAWIESLIKMEIEDRPQHVGPPITIVRIEKGSIRWIKKGVCQ